MGHIWFVREIVTLLLLIYTIEASVIPLRELHFTSDLYSESQRARATDEEYHLPVTVTPVSYIITLTPDFVDFVFDGEVEISVTAEQETDNISLHYNNMTLHSTEVLNERDEFLNFTEDYNEETNIYTILLDNTTEPGNYTIRITYTGHLLDDMAGFYRSSYTTADGEQR
jgi:aminopeptidase 2